LSVVVAIGGLALLILIHEAGHFVVALAVRMRPRSFYVGFPFPPLVKVKRKGIEFGIGAIPLGGMVRIPGMHRPAPSDVDVHFGAARYEAPDLNGPIERIKRPLERGDLDAAEAELPVLEDAVRRADLSPAAARAAERGLRDVGDALAPDAYWRQRTWKRIAVIAAGPGTNLVFAILLLAIVYMAGIPTASRIVKSVEPKSPAATAGLEPGDMIVSVNGEWTPSFDAVRKKITGSHGRPLAVGVVRGDKYVALTPVRPKKTEGSYILGFRFDISGYKHYSPPRALALAAEDTWTATKRLASFLVHITRRSNRSEIATPVGIVSESSEAVRIGYRDYLLILAVISLSLALLNMLPLLPLDGGHIAFSIVEGVRGRAVGRAVYERVSAIGIALILVLYAIGISNDINRIGGG
jgi:regulator of sigma E protease